MLHRRVHTRGAETDTSIGNVVGIARTSGLRHPGSLQSDPVKRADPPTTGIRGLVRRLARVLALAEEMLETRADRPPDSTSFERHLAFRWDTSRGTGRLEAIEEPDPFDLNDLLGVETAVSKLVTNFEQFIGGLPCNHVLLFGERGTGKSSAVKGLLSRFAGRGLRVVEIHKDHLNDLPRIYDQLRNLPQRFVLFCDDLSFDASDSRHRELKAALEGSLAAPPGNVRIVATSNRRHLIQEMRADSHGAHLDDAGELHMGATVEEKLALSDRFGLLLGFYGFDQPTYLSIVDHYAAKAGVTAERSVLHFEALRWGLERSSRSGRTARQFVDDFAGREALRRRD